MAGFRMMVFNPTFPKDRSKAKELTEKQFNIVNPYIVAQLNAGKHISEPEIMRILEAAGEQLTFDTLE